MKKKSTIAITGLAALLALGSVASFADDDSKTVTKETNGKYDEQYKGDDGTKSEYHVNKKDGTSVYKDNDGTVVKEKTEDGKVKQEYKDGDCKQSSQKDVVTGD